VLRGLTGVEPLEIAWMYADARDGAFGLASPDAAKVEVGDLVAHFGTLAVGDRYFSGMTPIRDLFPEGCDVAFGNDHGAIFDRFVENLPHVRTLISDAAYDVLMLSELAPRLLAADARLGDVRIIDGDSPRRRRIQFRFAQPPAPGEPLPEGRRDIAFPRYEAGHAVSIGAPAELAADVENFLAPPAAK